LDLGRELQESEDAMDLEKSPMGETMKQMKDVKLADHGIFYELPTDESLLG
jgi:hypothetical protein